MSIEVNEVNWEKEVIQSEIPVVADFWAAWCGPCKLMEPIFEKMAEKYRGKIKFVRLNVDHNPEITSRYGIMSIPTFIIFKKGKEYARLVGAIQSKKFENFVKKALEED
jgi:thioredoxin 1